MPFTTATAVGTGVTLAAVSADLALVGAGVAAAAQIQAGKQQQKALEFNAAVQRNQAIREEFAAQGQADIIRERGRRLQARQRTQFAKAGVGLAGSPLLVFEETASIIAEDVSATLFGGRQRASFSRSQAGFSLAQGRSAFRAGVIGAGTSLLSGASTSIRRFQGF